MEFDTKKFLDEKFEARTADIPVPDMAEWFTGSKKAPKENGGVAQQYIWAVRGLTHPGRRRPGAGVFPARQRRTKMHA